MMHIARHEALQSVTAFSVCGSFGSCFSCVVDSVLGSVLGSECLGRNGPQRRMYAVW